MTKLNNNKTAERRENYDNVQLCYQLMIYIFGRHEMTQASLTTFSSSFFLAFLSMLGHDSLPPVNGKAARTFCETSQFVSQ